jgi:hypothetical protein
MNRTILLLVGVASGMWALDDLRPSVKPTTSCAAEETTCSAGEETCSLQPRSTEPAMTPGPVKSISAAQSTTANEAGTIRAVKYTVLVQDESSPAEIDEPEVAAPQTETSTGDRAALGRWATGLLGPLVKKPALAPKSAATDAAAEARRSDDSAKPQTEHVAQRSPTVATPAAPTPITPDVAPTDKQVAKPTENRIDSEKPAVTAATPEDTVVTDEKPAAAAKTALSTTDSSNAAATAPTPAATEPKKLDPATSSVSAPAAKASPAGATPKETSPVAASPAVLPPASLSPVVHPQLAVPVRPPLTPELVALSQKVRYALWMHQHQRLLNTGTNASWEVMHRIVSYGAATEVLRDGPKGEPINAIGWLLWGGRCNSQPLLILSGGRPFAQVGPGVQGHNGQFLGMLAQSHVRPDSPFELQGQHFTVRDLIEQEKLSCEPNTELTFELIALSYYLKSDEVWTARSGEQWSISRLIQEEIKQPINGAACGGSHRLFGLTSAYKMRIAEGKPVDGDFLRAQKYVRAYQSYALNSIHNRDGSFSTDWFQRPADNGDLDRKIQTTGHILEWLVFSLEDNQLRDPRVVQSVDFLATQIVTHPDRAWSVGPLGHALHAIAIYESRVLDQPSPQPKQQQTASAKASDLPEPTRAAPKANLSSLPPQPKADPARPSPRPLMTRPTIGTPNAAAATAELQGPDLGVTR